jgi:hypothetical protein
MNASKALLKSMEEALDSLGKSATKTIMWQLGERGVDMAPDNFNVNKFALVLEELLGEGSETVLGIIYRNMCKQLKIDAVDSDLPALEKINRILEAKKMS